MPKCRNAKAAGELASAPSVMAKVGRKACSLNPSVQSAAVQATALCAKAKDERDVGLSYSKEGTPLPFNTLNENAGLFCLSKDSHITPSVEPLRNLVSGLNDEQRIPD